MSTASSNMGATKRNFHVAGSFKGLRAGEPSGGASTVSRPRGSHIDAENSHQRDLLGPTVNVKRRGNRIFTEGSEMRQTEKDSIFRTQTDEYYQGSGLKPSFKRIRGQDKDKKASFKIRSRNSSSSRSRHSILADEPELLKRSSTLERGDTKGFKSSSFVVPGEAPKLSWKTSSQRNIMMKNEANGYDPPAFVNTGPKVSKVVLRSRSTEPTKEGTLQSKLQAKASSTLEFSKSKPLVQLREEQE